jgi:hypothetical protein
MWIAMKLICYRAALTPHKSKYMSLQCIWSSKLNLDLSVGINDVVKDWLHFLVAMFRCLCRQSNQHVSCASRGTEGHAEDNSEMSFGLVGGFSLVIEEISIVPAICTDQGTLRVFTLDLAPREHSSLSDLQFT